LAVSVEDFALAFWALGFVLVICVGVGGDSHIFGAPKCNSVGLLGKSPEAALGSIATRLIPLQSHHLRLEAPLARLF
jgi:hypothetical protein